jgi:type II secretory pathway pseudopilin PulG
VATLALVVSILAIAISALTFWYVRRQAVAAEQQAAASQTLVATDTQRSHVERTPGWAHTLEQSDTGDWYTLSLRLMKSEPLDSVVVVIFDASGISFAPSQKGVDPSLPSPVLTATCGKLIEGEQAVWRLALDAERSSVLHLHVESTAAGETWKSALHVDVPGDPSQSVW